jgi:hypothetical protein
MMKMMFGFDELTTGGRVVSGPLLQAESRIEMTTKTNEASEIVFLGRSIEFVGGFNSEVQKNES